MIEYLEKRNTFASELYAAASDAGDAHKANYYHGYLAALNDVLKEYEKDILAKNIIGLPFDTAREIMENAGYKLRLTRSNGAYQIVTRDYRADRLNVWTDFFGIVTKATGWE